MRITILAHAEPEADETFGAGVGQVASGLRKGGHRVSILGVHTEIGKLISGMKRRQPDLIFNLVSLEPDAGPGAAGIVGLLELLGLPYTGNGPGEFYIQGEPALVRPLLGLNGESKELQRLGAPSCSGAARVDVDAFTVGLLGNDKPRTFMPLPRDETNVFPLTASVREQICDVSRLVYRALRVRDYGLVDVRVTPGGAVRPIGARAETDLNQDGEYARSAAAAGIDYISLVNQIAELAIERAGLRPTARLI
jgi:hypothetical protein